MSVWTSSFAVTTALITATASAATIPYNNDFSSQADDFATTGTPAWSVSNGTFNHTSTAAGTWTALAAFPQLGGTAATASDFGITADMTTSAANGTASYTALAALGSSAANGYQFRITAAITSGVGMSIYRNGASVATGGTNVQLRFLLNVPLRYAVTGTYIDTNSDAIDDALSLSFNVTRTDTNASFGTVNFVDPIPLTQSQVGFIDNNANNQAFTVAWDNISVVPEPASLSLALLGGVALLRRRR